MATFDYWITSDAFDQSIYPGGVCDDSSTLYIGCGNSPCGTYDHAYIALRFRLTDIAQGEIIESAIIRFRIKKSLSSFHIDAQIYAYDTDNAGTGYINCTSITQTSSKVHWTDIITSSAGEYYYLPDISAVVQEIVDRPGWNAGNYIYIVIRSDDGSDVPPVNAFYAYNNNSSPSYVAHLILKTQSGLIAYKTLLGVGI